MWSSRRSATAPRFARGPWWCSSGSRSSGSSSGGRPTSSRRDMRSRIHVLTLGVRDLDRSLAFYRALGLESEGIIGTEFPGGAVALFHLEGGLILALYGRDDLEQDANATF